MAEHYRGRRALVLGASEGLGRAVAEALAGSGAHVTLAARTEARLRAAAEAVRDRAISPDQRIAHLGLDATDGPACRDVLSAWASQHGAPDFLVNCVGFAHPSYVTESPLEVFEAMMRSNYLGQVYPTVALLPSMIERGEGHVVHTSSVLGFMGLFGYAGYCGSKHAVVGFSEALRSEVAPLGIRVSVLCPPTMPTPGLARENAVKPEEVRRAEEKGGAVQPERVARHLLRSLPRNRLMIVPTLEARLGYYLHRFLPGLLAYHLRRPAPAREVG